MGGKGHSRNAVRRKVLGELVHVRGRGHKDDAKVSAGVQDELKERQSQVDVHRTLVDVIHDHHCRVTEQAILKVERRDDSVRDYGHLLDLGLDAFTAHVESHEAAACVAVNV